MVRPLTPADADALVALRREALHDTPFAFSASPEDDRVLAPDYPRDRLGLDPDIAGFGAFEGATLVGITFVLRNTKLKERHRALVVSVYVTPAARGRGHAGGLLAAAIAWARTTPGIAQLELTVSETTPGAQRVYERAGFKAWGRQPRALRIAGRDADEIHMALPLD